MALRPAHLQDLYARRRENEFNRIQRTEAVNKYFDHWGKVTARFENWTTPEYYKQAEEQFQTTKQQKEKEKLLVERQKKLTQLFEEEKRKYELELREKEKYKHTRRSLDTKTMEKIDQNLKEQQQMRRRLELEAKLYGKWRHGVDDDNLVFESKNDNEVLAKLNWLDKQVEQQLEREKEEKAAKEHELKLQQELNRMEELQKERQQIREKEITEIRALQEYHMEQLRKRQKETDDLKQRENDIKYNLSELEKELELLEESYSVLSSEVDFSEAYNFKKIKFFLRKRSEVFRNHIKLCLSIAERILDFAQNSQALRDFKSFLEQKLETEAKKLSHLEAMYESEAKYSLQQNEELWQQELQERYQKLKQILVQEKVLIKTTLEALMKRHEELLQIKGTHLSVIENSSEKLKVLIQEEENSPRYQRSQASIQEDAVSKHVHFSPGPQTTNNIIPSQLDESAETPLYSPRRCPSLNLKSSDCEEPQHQVDFATRRNCYESRNNNMSPRCSDSGDLNKVSNSFSNLNLDVWQNNPITPTQRDLDLDRLNSQRSLQVVTPTTEAARPRFGRKRVAWN